MKSFFDFGHAARSIAAALFLCALSAGASTQVMSGQVPTAVQTLTATGRLAADTTMNVTIGLPLRNRTDLTNLLADIYNPASPKYHQYLTSAQFAEMFGPDKADYLALINFAKTHNLEIVGTHPNRTMLDVRAPASVMEAAFNVTLNVFQHPSEARTFFAPSREPSIEIGISVLSISGLNNYSLPKPMVHKKPLPAAKTSTPALGSGAGGTYLGSDFRNAYLPNVTLTGSGQSVALLEYDGYFPNDIFTYESIAGLPSVLLTNVLINGYSGAAGANNVEVALDIEMAAALAPGLSSIIVYEIVNDGNSILPIINRIATDNAARQISSSWGGGAFATVATQADQAFQQMAAQGQTFFNASGDFDAVSQVAFAPSDDPYIISVGGTTLSTVGPGGPYQSETVWNWGGGVGSSGGVSGTYPIPVWQQGINMTTNLGSVSLRNYPDVSLVADNIFVIVDNGQPNSVGGTSAASPLWAAFMALVNQQAVNVGHPALGFINPQLYSIAKGGNYANTFHDITTGDNTSPTSPTHFFAFPGYDLCTGWGSPGGSALIDALVPPVPQPFLLVLTNLLNGGNGNGLVDFNECNTVDILVTNAGTRTATGVEGIISTTTPGVTVATSQALYPDIAPGAAAFGRTSFRISTTPNFVCGTTVILSLVLKSDQTTTTNTVLLASGVVGKAISFTSTNSPIIPDNDPNGVYVPITVTNVDSPIRNVTVSLYITHTFDADLHLELISPDGTTVVLSANEGGAGDNYGAGCAPDSVRTTFDDAATLPISSANPPFVGSFRPEQLLAAFSLKTGSSVNGVWQLHAIDQVALDQGILQCWSLNVFPSVCQDGGGECPGADLGVTMTADPNPVRVSSNLTYTIVVTNSGPGTAKGVIVNQTLPANCVFVSATSSQGSAGYVGGFVSANIGTLSVGSTAMVSVVVYPTSAGTISSTANVGSPTFDFNTANNSATVSTSVQFPSADMGVTMTASPNPVFAGGPLTYTIMVTNNGPFTASGVTLTVNLPPNINLVSKDITQGGFVAGSGSTLIASVGIVPVGSNIVATVIVRPTTPGNIFASAQVSVDNNTTDPFIGNNSASAAITVIAAADVAVSIFSAPNPVITTSNYTYFITVTNNGPVDATGVIINQTLPANMVVVSTNATTGVVSSNGPGAITWTIPSLLNGTGALLTEVVTAPTIPFNAVSKTTNVISTAVISAQQGDANITNNTATSITVVSVPIITVVPAAALLTAESISPADGAIEPNETVTIQFGLRNIGNIPSTNLVATLLSTGGVTLPSGPQTYGVLVPSGPAVSMPFSFTAGTNPTIIATLQLQDGASNLPPVTFSFVLPTVTTYSNSAPITILDNAPASPYPSRIVVSNYTGFVGKVSVTLSNMNHTYPDDIDILLVHPSGRTSILMSDAGGGFSLVNASPTFDRTASAVVSDEGQIVTAAYKPFDYEPGDIFPTNAPVGPYQANLSAFEGITPNGTWSLYVADDTGGDFGIISNGWTLAITKITPVNKITDLAVGIALSPTNQLLTGATAVYTVSVTNNGPDTATGIVLTNVLPNGVGLVSVTGAAYTQSGQTLVFNLGNISATSNAAVVITGTVNSAGALTDKAAVTGNEIDPNLANNAASLVLNASLPPADLAAAFAVSANPVIVGSNLVYTLVVTNNGPSAALSVTGLLTYANMAFVSAVASQGNVVHTGSSVQCNFGNLPVGNIADVILTLTPSIVGIYTNTWSVNAGSYDALPGNNSVTNVIAVNPPAPIIVANGAALLSESGLKNGAIDSGETVTISFRLANVGVASTTNLVATLQASGGVTPITTSRSYSPLSAGASGSQSFTFQATGVSGGSIVATLALTDNSFSLGTVSFNFTIPGTFSSTNTGGLIIPSSGPAAPYPSVLNITGLTGLVSKVVVNVTGLTHSFPDDIDMILVNPTGQKVILMSDVGGAHSISNVDLTFADAASASLPDSSLITSGTYKPTDFEPGDVFPGLSGTPSGPTLASLNGFPPNGNWSLYVVDDTSGDSGSISNWTLSLTTASTINPAANLTVTATATPDPAFGGNYVTYSVIVANGGPSAATNVVLTDTLPSGTTLVSAVVSQGTANTNVSGTVTAALGPIAANANASASIRVRTAQSGTIVNLASVTSDAVDLNPDDNSVTLTSTVLDAPSASLVAATTTNGLTLTLIGQPNQPYAVQVATNLGSPTNWVSVATNLAGPNGTFTYTDPQLHAIRRFYRAMRLSQ